MSLLQALILGIVQGLTEFLPISSSGHLTLVPFILGWDEPSLAFVVAAHVGTMLAVIWVFRDTVRPLVRTVLGWRGAPENERRVVRYLAIGTVPAVLVGLLFEAAVGDAFESPVLVSLLLGVTGYFLLSTESLVERRATATDRTAPPPEPRALDDMRDVDAVAIGVAQAVAILPGISRSGSTIGTGMRLGLSRHTAASFSFLLAIPVMFGAAVFELPAMIDESSGGDATAFLIGIVTSSISGFLAIRWFLKAIQRVGLRPFGIYTMFAMVAGLLTALARG